jgi:hypothetical protein
MGHIIFTLVLVTAALLGCAAQHPEETQHETTIAYGEKASDILARLPSAGELLFRFASDGHRYEIRAFAGQRGSDENRYLLLFEDGFLISVVTADTAIKAWGSVFGNYAIAPPTTNKFRSVVAILVGAREPLSSINFRFRPAAASTRPSRSREKFNAAGEFVTMGAIYSVFPVTSWYSPVLFGGAAVVAGVATFEAVVDARKDGPKGGSVRRYRAFVGKMEHIALLSDKRTVLAALGPPSSQIQVPNQQDETVFQYGDMPHPVAMGFASEQLVWIGYDYDAAEVMRRRKHFEDVMGPYHPLARSVWLNEYRVDSTTFPVFRSRVFFSPPPLDQEAGVAPVVKTTDDWKVTHVIDGVYLIQSKAFQSRHCVELRESRSRAERVLPPSCDSNQHGFLVDPAGNISGGWVRISLVSEERNGYILFNPIRHQRESWPSNPVFLAERHVKPFGKK